MTNQTNPATNINGARLMTDQAYRKEVAMQSHAFFFSIYERQYAMLPSAPMHTELLAMTENDLENAIVMAFRGSGKSTICTFSYPMWAVLGRQEKKMVVIISKTEAQAQRHLDNIKQEFEDNQLLRNDFGVIHEENSPWNSRALSFKTHGAMICALSIEQSIRGIRWRQYRPDLIIFDDIETREAVKTKEGRDQLFERITSDILPAGAPNHRAIFVGSNLHADSPLNRLIESAKSQGFPASVYSYPITDADGNPTWPAMYADKDAIDRKRRQIPDPRAWKQEYELVALVPEDQLITEAAFLDYEPHELPEKYALVICIDPAIKKTAQSDYTGIVSFAVTGEKDKQQMYVLPNIIRKRLSPTETAEEVRRIIAANSKRTIHVVIEDVGFQSALVEFVKGMKGIREKNIHLFHPHVSKEDRLYSICGYMENGTVRFPKGGCRQLRDEILEFGVARHDDLVDAFTSGVITIKDAAIRHVEADFVKMAMIMHGISREKAEQLVKQIEAEYLLQEQMREQHREYRRALTIRYTREGISLDRIPGGPVFD